MNTEYSAVVSEISIFFASMSTAFTFCNLYSIACTKLALTHSNHLNNVMVLDWTTQ